MSAGVTPHTIESWRKVSGSGVQAKIGTDGRQVETLRAVNPLLVKQTMSGAESISAAAQTATGMRDAAVWGTGAIGGTEIAACVMDFGFMGGSMGAVVGEKVARAAEHALAARVPLVVVSASGGARMQEGTLALMQLAKTLAALERLLTRYRRPILLEVQSRRQCGQLEAEELTHQFIHNCLCRDFLKTIDPQKAASEV